MYHFSFTLLVSVMALLTLQSLLCIAQHYASVVHSNFTIKCNHLNLLLFPSGISSLLLYFLLVCISHAFPVVLSCYCHCLILLCFFRCTCLFLFLFPSCIFFSLYMFLFLSTEYYQLVLCLAFNFSRVFPISSPRLLAHLTLCPFFL